MHHELQLWVQAGIPPAVALQAATGNAASCCAPRTASAAFARDWTPNLLLVDGNPLEDISATERISLVVFKGERRSAPIYSIKSRTCFSLSSP